MKSVRCVREADLVLLSGNPRSAAMSTSLGYGEWQDGNRDGYPPGRNVDLSHAVADRGGTEPDGLLDRYSGRSLLPMVPTSIPRTGRIEKR